MKTSNMLTIKTIYILASFLGLQFNPLSAAVNFSEPAVVSNENVLYVTNSMLLPAIPMVAIFEDATEVTAAMIIMTDLAPAIPMIADFSDGIPSMEISVINLVPVTPKEADFEDEPGIKNIISTSDLAPVTPAEADFEDQI